MTLRPSDWILATSNKGKVEELRRLLENAGVTLHAQDELGIAPAEETAGTFVENALLKARHASRLGGMPAIADDSGLAVDALDGAPGVRSARFAGPGGSDEDNVRRLLSLLKHVPERERTARFHCVAVALKYPDDPAPVIVTGVWAGHIALAAVGARGFGYDPVFVDDAVGITAAEMAPKVKNRLSHRGQALRALCALLERERRTDASR